MNVYFYAAFFIFLNIGTQVKMINFGTKNGANSWRVVNDGVMGGLSQGEVRLAENSVIFEGKVSLENNGGFSSYRSPVQNMDLSAYQKVIIRYKSQGIACDFTLATSTQFYRPNFKARLAKNTSAWQVSEFSLREIPAFQLGRPLNYTLSEEDLSRVLRLGFITGEKKAGPFRLEIDYIRFE